MSDEIKNKYQTPIHKIIFTAPQVAAISLIIASSMAGVGWYLYTTGSFAPNLELGKQAGVTQYAYEKAINDYKSELNISSDLRGKVSSMQAEISTSNNKIEFEKAKIQLEIAKLEFEKAKFVSENEKISKLVGACVQATTAGQDSRSETNGGGFQSGAAVAITAVSKQQNGSDVLIKCLDVYYSKEKLLSKNRK